MLHVNHRLKRWIFAAQVNPYTGVAWTNVKNNGNDHGIGKAK